MAEKLTDREFEALRQVRPFRTTPNWNDAGSHPERTAQAVVDADGNDLLPSVEDILMAMLIELRAMKLGMELSGLIEHVDITDVA